jgi:hypothetical protein
MGKLNKGASQMSMFTTAKSQDQQIVALVAEYLKSNTVTVPVTKRIKKSILSLASRHVGKPTYGRKSRRYA